jgi:membrane associated rhomboid family serine protease
MDADVGQKCPECAPQVGRGRVIQARTVVRRSSMAAATPLAIALIVINSAIFLLGELIPDLGDRMFVEGAQWKPAIELNGEWYRALSAMFLHGGLTHVLFNMWALWLFGPVLERRFGSPSFLALYLASGLSGSALYHLIGGTAPAVGASGAIFGLFGAVLAASYRQRHTPAGRAVFGQLALLLAINLVLPFVVRNIAWEAHVGGLLAGLVIAYVWDQRPFEGRNATAARVMVALAVAAAALAAVILG